MAADEDGIEQQRHVRAGNNWMGKEQDRVATKKQCINSLIPLFFGGIV